MLRENDRAFWELCRAFPQHRRLIENVRKLSMELDRRLLRQPKAEQVFKQEAQRANGPNPSARVLSAARQAIFELGPDADRQSLLARADAIWKLESGALLESRLSKEDTPIKA